MPAMVTTDKHRGHFHIKPKQWQTSQASGLTTPSKIPEPLRFTATRCFISNHHVLLSSSTDKTPAHFRRSYRRRRSRHTAHTGPVQACHLVPQRRRSIADISYLLCPCLCEAHCETLSRSECLGGRARVAQADSRPGRAKALCHAQVGPSNAPQERVYRLRKRMREDSGIRWLTFLFFLEFHAWSVFVIGRRPTRCWVPYHQKHIPDGPFPERALPQQLL